MAVLCLGDSLAALALRSFRPLSFSRAPAAAVLCEGAFAADCPAEVNDWTISKTTSFMERGSWFFLERFGMGVLLKVSRQRRIPFRGSLAVTPLMATPLPAWVAAGTSLITIILPIAFNAFLLLDFTRAILGAFTFHDQFSFPRCLCFAVSSPRRRDGGGEREQNRNETAPRFPTGRFSCQVTLLLLYSRSLCRDVIKDLRWI